ncbi:MAG: hypothetical protein JRJ76_11630 [Deltaproteobacteria bacterium]|nr:hypothetical protein [Deltaproteobacteria bacterium]
MPRKRDFACAQQAASKGEAIPPWRDCDPLVTPHMKVPGSPIGWKSIKKYSNFPFTLWYNVFI